MKLGDSGGGGIAKRKNYLKYSQYFTDGKTITPKRVRTFLNNG